MSLYGKTTIVEYVKIQRARDLGRQLLAMIVVITCVKYAILA